MITLFPDTKTPVDPNPTVESTVITDDPAETLVIDFTFGWTLKVPSTVLLSVYPTKRFNL